MKIVSRRGNAFLFLLLSGPTPSLSHPKPHPYAWTALTVSSLAFWEWAARYCSRSLRHGARRRSLFAVFARNREVHRTSPVTYSCWTLSVDKELSFWLDFCFSGFQKALLIHVAVKVCESRNGPTHALWFGRVFRSCLECENGSQVYLVQLAEKVAVAYLLWAFNAQYGFYQLMSVSLSKYPCY